MAAPILFTTSQQIFTPFPNLEIFISRFLGRCPAEVNTDLSFPQKWIQIYHTAHLCSFMQVSSAKRGDVEQSELGMAIAYSGNGNELGVDPWGTPQSLFRRQELCSCKETTCCLSRKVLINISCDCGTDQFWRRGLTERLVCGIDCVICRNWRVGSFQKLGIFICRSNATALFGYTEFCNFSQLSTLRR